MLTIGIPEIPHGHGLSFKKGLSDGLLDLSQYESEFHETHLASYRKGKEVGSELKGSIAKHVKP